MNNWHRKILERVFADRVSGTIDWAEVEALLRAVGCEVVEGDGSRVRFVFGSHVETFHRPHPKKEAQKYQIRATRAFLTKIKKTPDTIAAEKRGDDSPEEGQTNE